MKKFNEIGRSMVEMLGVLAIIGVLSVGAIAGYSKAMMKHKLNKQAEQLNTLIISLLRHADRLTFTDGYQNITPVLLKLNEIPKEMIKHSTSLNIFDPFNTKIELSCYYTNPGKSLRILFDMEKKSNNENIEVCKNILTVSKEYHKEIAFIQFIASDDQKSVGVVGDAKCNNANPTCIKNLDINMVHSFCTSLENRRQITIQFER